MIRGQPSERVSAGGETKDWQVAETGGQGRAPMKAEGTKQVRQRRARECERRDGASP